MTAFINALREEGTKEDCLAAVERLWDQLTAARLAGKIEGLKEAAVTLDGQAQMYRDEAHDQKKWGNRVAETSALVAARATSNTAKIIRAKITELQASSTDSASHSSEAGSTTAPPLEEPSA